MAGRRSSFSAGRRRALAAGGTLAAGSALTAGTFLAGVASLAPALASAASTPSIGEPERLELRYQGWNSLVLYPELAEDLGYLAPIRLKWIGNTISGPQDIQAAVTGDVDFGGAFNGSILKLHAAGAPIQAVIAYLGIDEQTQGGVYVVNDSQVRVPRDLIGRRVGVNTLGAYQEYVINTWLERGGLSADEIRKVTLVAAPPVNLAQLLRARQLDAVFLQDLVKDKSLADGGLRELFIDQQLLGSVAFASYVLTQRFIERHPNSAHRFVNATARAIDWAQRQPRDEVVARLKTIVAKRQRNEEQGNVQFWKSASLGARGGVIQLQDFATYADWYKKNGQFKPGQVDARAVYTNRFNPFAESAAAGPAATLAQRSRD